MANKLEEYIEKYVYWRILQISRVWYQHVGRINYSDRYSDDEYEYRHVILPKPLLKLIPKQFFNPDGTGTLRLLTEQEWRGIGITQSLGWQHYEVHGESTVLEALCGTLIAGGLAPEPNVLLFRRPKNFGQPAAAPPNGRAAKEVRKK